ncbi:MAG TPA: diguanylate cyclase [Patescibacteria group bacterium]|nr:diguanylate cyclase [Patescibacteria group bacterium]
MDTSSTPIRAAKRRAAKTAAPAPEAASEEGAPAAPTPPTEPFAPVEHSFKDRRAAATARTRRSAHLTLRLTSDPQFLLAVAIALPVLAVEGTYQLALPWLVVAVPVGYVGLQLALTAWRSAPEWLAPVRLALALVFIVVANAWLDPTGTWPLSALAVPVVALAASRGDVASVAVALAGMVAILAPLAIPNADPGSRQQTLALAMAAGVVAFGCQRIVASLKRSTERVRSANSRDRRRARQLAAVESVGSLLAREGPTTETLDRMIGLLEETFHYRYPSVYVWDGRALQLGAHRNYRFPIQTVTPDKGVIGRIVRSRQPAFLPDARSDPDFLSGDPEVVSEIGIPLVAGGELMGVLNVETSGEHRLDEDDFSMIQIVGDRLAVALALGRERLKLTERAALLDRLTTFATVLNASLESALTDDEIAAGAGVVIPADSVVIIHRDEATSAYRIRAVVGGDTAVVGNKIELGEGISGRAIVARKVMVTDRLERSQFPKAVAKAKLPDVLAAMSAPMVIGDQIAGVVTWLRGDLARPFSDQEQEVAALAASRVGLSLANARLHQKTRDAAITDPLTGIHNRRHFDAALAHQDALRQRIPAEKRGLRSAILFDLDHFGSVNKRFGHQVGDRVLRLFADTLKTRIRGSDLMARYGGEEFVVVLEGASRDEAIGIAEQVRAAYSKQSVDTGTGQRLNSTVSAGCSTLEAWEVEGVLLLERADVALAMAKAGGRDQVVAA